MRYVKFIWIKGEKKDLSKHLIIKKDTMDQEMEKLIWDFIDERCSPEDKEIISRRLAEDQLWKDSYLQLLGIHDMLKKDELEVPSLRFSKNIMEEIANYQVAPAAKSYINKNVIRIFAAFFLTMIIGLFIYFLGQIHWVNQSSNNLIPTYSQEADKINWSKFLNNSYVNIFIGINIILGLILTDKYFQGKRNSRYAGNWTKGDSA
jgi:hypothetical protein